MALGALPSSISQHVQKTKPSHMGDGVRRPEPLKPNNDHR